MISPVVDEAKSPFDSIEGAYQYVSLLGEAVEEAQGAIQKDIAQAHADAAARRLEALHIVSYKLGQLKDHIGASRRILNDLRTLRRLLLPQREDRLSVRKRDEPSD